MAALDDTQTQIREFLRVLRRRRWLIFMPAIFVFAIGSSFAVIVPKKYAVSTTVMIKESRNELDSQAKNPRGSATTRELNSVTEHIRNYRRVRQVVDTQGKLWGNFVNSSEEDRTKIVKSIMRNISVMVAEKKKDEGSTFVEITYKDVEGERAERFLEELTDVWINDVVDGDISRLQNELDVLQNQVFDAQRSFNEVNAQFVDLAKQMEIDPSQPVASMPQFGSSPGDWYFRELEAVKTKRENVDTDLSIALGTLSRLQGLLENEPPEVPKIVEADALSFTGQIADAQQEIERMSAIQRRYKPAHSQYKFYQGRIDELESQIRLARELEQQGGAREIWGPNPKKQEYREAVDLKHDEVATLRIQLEQQDKRVRELTSLTQKRQEDYRDLANLQEERDLAREYWDDMVRQENQKNAALIMMRTAYGKPYEIAEPANFSDSPKEPSSWIIVAFSLFAGLALGLSVAMLTEYAGNTYRTVSDLTSVMAIPVLGTVNAIITRPEARRLHTRRLVVGVSSAVILGGLAWLTWVWYVAPHQLPVEVLEAIEDFRLMLM